jgi:mRNA interferase MazF
VARVLRGEIRWAELRDRRGRERAGRHPVLIVSQDVFNQRSGTVIAMAITRRPQRAGFPLTLELSAPTSSPRSWVKIHHIRIVPVGRIGKRLGRATPEALAQVMDGLLEIIGP